MKAVVALGIVALFSFLSRPAAADEVAPAFESADLRAYAASAMTALPKPTGTYVAFDPEVTDAFAQVACDDDGDPVVVISAAMLQLVAQVMRVARSRPEALASYASYLAKNQAPGKRLLPPPPGTFTTTDGGTLRAEDAIGALSFVLAREVEHLRARDLVCPHPTATKESGDAVWTAAERSAAAATARTVYPGQAAVRDEAALNDLVDTAGVESVKLDVLAFFAAFEAEHAKAPARVAPSYLTTHPGSAARLAAAKAVLAKRGASL
ncbi:MAG: hypothetical protein KIT84_34025 [Labilithrix sp.]|nr:hypothetical protein [Labilithrix sp.]MCW5816066.1 hypothetical protein [Labilithrix sp.]